MAVSFGLNKRLTAASFAPNPRVHMQHLDDHDWFAKPYGTIIDVLKWNADTKPERLAYTYLGDGSSGTAQLTYRQLFRKAMAIASELRRRGAAGERALILCRSGLDYVCSFWGCLFGGVVAVPHYPIQRRRSQDAVRAVIRDSGAAFAISESTRVLETVAGYLPINLVSTRDIPDDSVGDQIDCRAEGKDLAYLQYTSGSTQDPRGVEITHANIMSNQAMVQSAFGMTSESVILNWLPMYHDMGLCSGVLQPVFARAHCYLMDPLAFVRNPGAWLRSISKFRITTSGGPDSAYDLCVRRTDASERELLDLTCWTTAFSGSEPVRAATLSRFYETFSPVGFHHGSFFPCYGLAEATLLVSARQDTPSPRTVLCDKESFHLGRIVPRESCVDAYQIVSCGKAINQRVIVVDPRTKTECQSGQIGEIWISGASVSRGYWRREAETQETFHAYVGDTGEGPFLRTGDLGSYWDDELFVTGRHKDILIFGGRNYYPHDIESTVLSNLAPWDVAESVALEAEVSGRAQLTVLVAFSRKPAESSHTDIFATIRASVAREHGLAIHRALIVPLGSIPKTTSGKMRRMECRVRLRKGAWDNVAYVSWPEAAEKPQSPESGGNVLLRSESNLQGQVAEIRQGICEYLSARFDIPCPNVDPRQSPVAYGLDSLSAAELAEIIASRWGKDVPVVEIIDCESIAELARQAGSKFPTSYRQESVEKLPINESELSSEQERLWILQQLDPKSCALNLQAAYRLRGELNTEALASSISRVILRHDSLRTIFATRAGRPVRRITENSNVPLRTCSLPSRSGDVNQAIMELAQGEWSRPFDCEKGPLIRILLAHVAERDYVFIITVHHLVSDALSLDIFARDLTDAYKRVVADDSSTVSGGVEPYGRYVTWQKRFLDSSEIRDKTLYWRSVLLDQTASSDTTRGITGLAPDRGTYSISISDHTQASLRTLAREENVTVFTIFLAALSIAMHFRTGERIISIGCPVQGRATPQFAKVFGLFAYPIVLRIDLADARTFRDVLHRTRRVVVGALANQDVPFSHVMAAVPSNRRPFSVMFGFFSQRAGMELPGVEVLPIAMPLGTVDGEVYLGVFESGGTLTASSVYDSRSHSHDDVISLMSDWVAVLDHFPQGPETVLSGFGDRHVPNNVATERASRQIVIAGSFTTEVMSDLWSFWISHLGLSFNVEFSPSGQVFQQLLDPRSALRRNGDGINVVLFRFDDLENGAGTVNGSAGEEFLNAVRSAREGTSAPLFIVLCPPQQASKTGPESVKGYSEWLRAISSTARKLPFVEVIDGWATAETYGVTKILDPYLDQTAQIPYTMEFFAAITTRIVRGICATEGVFQYKALVVDCDQTLWHGICGEDGPSAVQVDAGAKELQRTLLQQRSAGKIICLCSKNDLPDVREVFDSNSGMLLSLQDISAFQVNWRPKPDSVRAIAVQFNIGLDSIIFIDDDPVECGQMRASIPETLTLCFPQEESQAKRLLEHLWPFDCIGATSTASQRPELLRKEDIRKQVRRESGSLADFLTGLNLGVTISPVVPEEFPRISELTLRTNQFNLSGMRWSLAQLCFALESDMQCIGVHVKDRFGDYGLVGTLLYRPENDAVVVENCVLSCRALGRGVEHRMVAFLGETAVKLGLPHVDFVYRPLPRNTPALMFIEGLAPDRTPTSDGGALLRFEAHTLSNLKYDPERESYDCFSTTREHPQRIPIKQSTRMLERIATELCSAELILRASRVFRQTVKHETEYIAPRTPDEERMANIVGDLLGIKEVGVKSNFFDLGGNSILAARLTGRIYDEFGAQIPIRHLFDSTATVEKLLELVDLERVRAFDPDQLAKALTVLDGISQAQARELLTKQDDFDSGEGPWASNRS